MTTSVQELVRSLADQGWSASDFEKNQMGHVTNLDADLWQRMRVQHERYWRAAARISQVLREQGVFHVVIKTRRHYPYADSNVDVFIEENHWEQTRTALCTAGWRMPSPAVILKQRLIEREKIKLPPTDPGLAPAHVYKAVSWRYQRETTFLDLRMIDEVPLSEHAPGIAKEYRNLLIPMPSRSADILLHCAEIGFENYRVTLGEALYLSWLAGTYTASEWETARALAEERGAKEAIDRVLSQVMRTEKEGFKAQRPDEWPRNLTLRDLLAIWGERFRFQGKDKGKPVMALEEWLGYAVFATMYRLKRAVFK